MKAHILSSLAANAFTVSFTDCLASKPHTLVTVLNVPEEPMGFADREQLARFMAWEQVMEHQPDTPDYSLHAQRVDRLLLAPPPIIPGVSRSVEAIYNPMELDPSGSPRLLLMAGEILTADLLNHMVFDLGFDRISYTTYDRRGEMLFAGGSEQSEPSTHLLMDEADALDIRDAEQSEPSHLRIERNDP